MESDLMYLYWKMECRTPKGPYYDPTGRVTSERNIKHTSNKEADVNKFNVLFNTDHTHKRITLLPEKLTEESKVVLKSLFSQRELLEELSLQEANDIVVRASHHVIKKTLIT